MTYTVKKYTSKFASDYESLLRNCKKSMFTHSLKYRKLLIKNLNEAQDHYFCLFENHKLIAVLPTFIKDGPNGKVVNSLPFYGSHGGILSRQPLNNKAKEILFKSLSSLCSDIDAFSCVIVESPLEYDKYLYNSFIANFYDERIGQITSFKELGDDNDIEDSLLKLYHQKTRNMVRKGIKQNFVLKIDDSANALKKLHQIHNENILSVNGIPKPLKFFESIPTIFEFDKDYRIYTASSEGRIVSALLLFYFKDMVEYFTPATLSDYRNQQPMSLLIFTAMCDAIKERKSQSWNWGGTWKNQDGVYNFKKRWGAEDHIYKYYISHDAKNVKNKISKDMLTKNYQFFYTLPFSEIS
tara:strand:+ start:81 stop:1142 length:1062 start_codon:yes stop_codon:yes gene_type:complete